MRMMKSKFLVGFLSLLIATLVALKGQAQSQEAYPTKPIEIVVTFAPGGANDLIQRILASALSKKWGIPVNVVNKPGGNTIPGSLSVYTANPDGYTMLGDGSTSSSLGVTVKDLPFKIMDRTFVCNVEFIPHVFVVATNSPFKSLKDVAAEAKRNPGNFTWTANGTGTDSEGIACRQFFKAIDVDILKTKATLASGGGQGVILVAGGHSILAAPSLSSATASLKGGTLRALALTSKDRNPALPDVPTTSELGYPNINAMHRGAISGPPKLPAFIVAKWEKAIEEILRDPEVIDKMRNLGMTAAYLNSKETREFVIKETDEINRLWEGLIR